MRNFSDILAGLMIRDNLNRSQLAKLSGVNYASLFYYLNGNRVPRADELCKLSEFFGVSMDYLWGRDPNNSYRAGSRAAIINKQALLLVNQLKSVLAEGLDNTNYSDMFAAEDDT